MEALNQLSDNSRIWIYQCNRELTDTETESIRKKILEFADSWVSHSDKVIATGDVIYNRFIVLGADEAAFQVSGCSIDSSVQFIRTIESEFNLNLFDRLNVAYKINDEVKSVGKEEFQQLVDSNSVNEETIVFNNLITTKLDFLQKWEVPLKDSWHKRVFA